MVFYCFLSLVAMVGGCATEPITFVNFSKYPSAPNTPPIVVQESFVITYRNTTIELPAGRYDAIVDTGERILYQSTSEVSIESKSYKVGIAPLHYYYGAGGDGLRVWVVSTDPKATPEEATVMLIPIDQTVDYVTMTGGVSPTPGK
jgi:hypothetical protein